MKYEFKHLVLRTSYFVLNLLVFAWLFHTHFWDKKGDIGHDYSYFFPRLLNGYFWFKTNGLFAVPWFTPAFCGGVPVFPNPQDPYYSVPQFLAFFLDPITSIYITALLFASLGLFGVYFLLRRCFQISPAISAFGGSLFLFNTMYLHRFIVGHLSFHAFMLTPFLAFFMLRGADQKPMLKTISSNIALASLILSYMLYSGMVHLFLPVLLSTAAIGLIHGIRYQRHRFFWVQFVIIGLLTLGLCAAKLTAALSFLTHFSRDSYPLPGGKNILSTCWLLFQALFLGSQNSFKHAESIFKNMEWTLDIQEFEYSISWIPLLFFMGGIVYVFVKGKLNGLKQWRPQQWLILGVLIVILLVIPITLNTFHSFQWHTWIKKIPILKSSANLLRWFLILTLPTILTTALIWEHIPFLQRHRRIVLGASLFLLLIYHISYDRHSYQDKLYSPQNIQAAFQKYRQTAVPPIEKVGILQNKSGRYLRPVDRDDALSQGISYLWCYEPLFGYRLEFFPQKPLHPGLVEASKEGVFNLKNPACYVFPETNNCQPGAHFTLAQETGLKSFTHYQPYSFQVPLRQKVANVITLLSWGVLGVLGVLGVWGVREFGELGS